MKPHPPNRAGHFSLPIGIRQPVGVKSPWLSGWWLNPTPLKNDGVRQLG